MWPHGYFSNSYWTGAYFPPSVPVVLPVTGGAGSHWGAGRRILMAHLVELERRRSLQDRLAVRGRARTGAEVLFQIMMERLELDFQQRQNQVASYVALLSEL